MVLAAEHVSYTIGRKTLVADVSLEVKPGKMVAVVGANGAGKSTLMKLLCGDLRIQQGTVTLDGRTLAQWPKRELARVRAVLPQTSQLTFGFTALEVALMGRAPHVKGVESAADHDIVRAALAAAHVEHLAEQSYLTLSGGEQQRVQLARVLSQIWEGTGPRYLLLDEPTNNLDLAHQHGTLRIAADFARRGVGVLAILHDLNLAAQYADYILMMKNGQVLAYGAPGDVLTQPLIWEAFAMSVIIAPHPALDRPLVITDPHAFS